MFNPLESAQTFIVSKLAEVETTLEHKLRVWFLQQLAGFALGMLIEWDPDRAAEYAAKKQGLT